MFYLSQYAKIYVWVRAEVAGFIIENSHLVCYKCKNCDYTDWKAD